MVFQIDERLIPTIDFGHLNARDCGVLKTVKDFEGVLSKIENGLGAYRAKNFHSHFSKIEYTTGGERRHLTFEDNEYGPEFEPLAEVIINAGQHLYLFVSLPVQCQKMRFLCKKYSET